MRIIFLILSTLLIISCATQEKNVDINPWTYKSIDKSELTRIDHTAIPLQTLNKVREDYEKNPEHPSYTKLKLYAAFEDKLKHTTTLAFDILYVSDVTVIYVINDNGHILQKHLQSSWD